MKFGTHIPDVQLTKAQLRTALDRAGLRGGETYIELGSGDGAGLVLAANEYQANAIGVEYQEAAIERTRKAARAAGVNVDVGSGDLLEFDPSPADVLLLHLGPAFHDLLAPRLEQLLRAPTRVVTWGWEVPGWVALPDPVGFTEPCYLYQPGAPRQHGLWQTAGTSRTLPLNTTAVDAVGFTAGVDLHDIEVRIEGAVAEVLEARAATSRLGRGQSMLIELRWAPGAHAAAVQGGSLELWARSRTGRFTARGSAHPVALQTA